MQLRIVGMTVYCNVTQKVYTSNNGTRLTVAVFGWLTPIRTSCVLDAGVGCVSADVDQRRRVSVVGVDAGNFTTVVRTSTFDIDGPLTLGRALSERNISLAGVPHLV